jgi:hypothetical protein
MLRNHRLAAFAFNGYGGEAQISQIRETRKTKITKKTKICSAEVQNLACLRLLAETFGVGFC